jgi:hypothetical protein
MRGRKEPEYREDLIKIVNTNKAGRGGSHPSSRLLGRPRSGGRWFKMSPGEKGRFHLNK